MKQGMYCFALGFVLAAVSLVSADTIVIDDFSDPVNQTTTSGGNQNAWADSTSTVLGSIRDGSIGCETYEDAGLTTAKFSDGELEVYTNTKASPSMYLAYDGTEGWGTNLDTAPFNGTFAAFDLTDGGGNDRFGITFSAADGADGSIDYFNDVLLTVQVAGTLYSKDFDTEANAWMAENYDALNAGTAATFEVDFSGLSGADMSQVEAICLHICSENTGMDFTLDAFEAIPEPAAATLVCFFGISLLSIRRLFNR